MKKIAIAFVTLILVAQIAGCTISPVDAGADMVSKGIDMFIKKLCDQIFDTGIKINNATMPNNVSNSIFRFATYTYDPMSDDNVTRSRWRDGFIALILIIMYIFIGLAASCISRYFPSHIDGFNDMTQGIFDAGAREYTKNILIALGVMTGSVMYVTLVLKLNYVLCALTMSGVLNQIAPTADNIPLYFIMAICYLIMSVFFAIRGIIIVLVCAHPYLIGFLLVATSTRHYGLAINEYFLQVVFFQFIIIVVTSSVVMCTGGNSIGSMIGDPFLYVGMMILLVIIGILMITPFMIPFVIRKVRRI